MSNHSVKFYTILQIISYIIEKQVGEDDILFTKPLVEKGLIKFFHNSFIEFNEFIDLGL